MSRALYTHHPSSRSSHGPRPPPQPPLPVTVCSPALEGRVSGRLKPDLSASHRQPPPTPAKMAFPWGRGKGTGLGAQPGTWPTWGVHPRERMLLGGSAGSLYPHRGPWGRATVPQLHIHMCALVRRFKCKDVLGTMCVSWGWWLEPGSVGVPV